MNKLNIIYSFLRRGVCPGFFFPPNPIDIPSGKTLADINPEAARFYDGLGETKMTGKIHDAVGDIYMQYLDAPERVVSNSDFAPLERAYRIYEASPTIEHASAFLDEAGKVQRVANRNGYGLCSAIVMHYINEENIW